jgi:xanthine dehydrogenase/oxidase
MGGGFGGKETRPPVFASIAGLAALVTGRPISFTLDRDVDMSITGQRHAFKVNYEVGCKMDGTFTYFQAELFNNGGFSLDMSQGVIDRALFHIDNCYHWPATNLSGKVCFTNQSSHTAFRGFGAVQGMITTETIIGQLAEKLKVSSEFLRYKNLYQEGDSTPYGTKLIDFYIPSLWEKIMKLAEIEKRKLEIEEFNSKNQFVKRGLSLVPTKYGINYTAKFMNQGGSLIHIYRDGSVFVSHGGTEMGQGLFTKMIQIVSETLGVPHELVINNETSTAIVANTSPTAASMGNDLYGMAVLDACRQLLERLQTIRYYLLYKVESIEL